MLRLSTLAAQAGDMVNSSMKFCILPVCMCLGGLAFTFPISSLRGYKMCAVCSVMRIEASIASNSLPEAADSYVFIGSASISARFFAQV